MNPRIALAALLPALVFTLAAGRALHQRQAGDEYTLLIGGYDPRDPLRGHYLQYRYEVDGAQDSCGDEPCCFCIDDTGEPQALRPVACGAPPACAALLPHDEGSGAQRYYIPEEGRRELEKRVRAAANEDRAAVLVGVEGGQIHVRALLIDGEPAL